MGIIDFIRKMRNLISAALLTFVASAQAGFLTGDYADVGRNLNAFSDALEKKVCRKGYEKRDKNIEDLRKSYCRMSMEPKPITLERVCEMECDGDKFVGANINNSVVYYRATNEFCGICCDNGDDEK